MKKQILIVNDEMVMGGVARVLNNMLKYLNYEKYDIDVLILHKHGELLKDIDSRVRVLEEGTFFHVCDLSLKDALKSKKITLIIKKLYFLFLMKSGLIKNVIAQKRRSILKKKYDVEIAYKEGFCTIFTAYGDSVKKVNWVHVDYKQHNYSKHHMKLMKDALSKIDVMVTLTKQAMDSYNEVFQMQRDFFIINNFIDVEKIKKLALEPYQYPTDDFTIISIGRLHFQKAYPRLMNVIHRLKGDGLTFKVYILGDGPDKDTVYRLIKEYQIQDYVEILGFDSNPFKYIANADLFLLQSLYEGAPTVIYEALTVNTTPILSTDVSGVKEQLNNGEYGMICSNDEEGLYTSLKQILKGEIDLEHYKKTMKQYRNTNEISLKQIESIFDEA